MFVLISSTNTNLRVPMVPATITFQAALCHWSRSNAARDIEANKA
jgi:hypothetical protein